MIGGNSYLDSLQSPKDNDDQQESSNSRKEYSNYQDPSRDPTILKIRPEETSPMSADHTHSQDELASTNVLAELEQETEMNLFHETSIEKLRQQFKPIMVGAEKEGRGMTTTMMSTPPPSFNNNNNNTNGPRNPRSFGGGNNGPSRNNNGPPPNWEPRGNASPSTNNNSNNNGPPPGWEPRGGPSRNLNNGPPPDARRPDNVGNNGMQGGWNPEAGPKEEEVDPMAAYLAAVGQMKPPSAPDTRRNEGPLTNNNANSPRAMQPQGMQTPPPPSIRNNNNDGPPRSFTSSPPNNMSESGRRPMEMPPARNDAPPRSFSAPQSNNVQARPMEMPPARNDGPPRSFSSPPPPDTSRRPMERPPARNDGPPRSFSAPPTNNMPESARRPMEMPPARNVSPPPTNNNMPPPDATLRSMEMPQSRNMPPASTGRPTEARNDVQPRSFPQTPSDTATRRPMEMPPARRESSANPPSTPASFTPRPPTDKPFFATDKLDMQIDNAVSNAMNAAMGADGRNNLDKSNNLIEKKAFSQESLLQEIKESKEKLSGEWNDLMKSFAEPFTSILPAPKQFERPPPPKYQVKGMTERIMKRIPAERQASGAGGSSSWEAFQRAEKLWTQLKEFQPFTYDAKYMGRPDRNGNPPPQMFVYQDIAMGNPACWLKLREQYGKELDFDVVVCGGTLGIFFATALQLQGHNVCVVEAGELRGREQEWNLSFDELYELVEMGVLTEQDIDDAIQTDFPGCRSGFKNKEVTPLEGGYMDNRVGFECFTEDVLNLGVAPTILLQRAAKTFVNNGGVIKERTRMSGVAISELIGAAVDIGEDKEPITARLIIDCMGNGSPISRQQRHGQKPDGVCVVVGSCASGYDAKTNVIGDLIYTNQVIADKGQNGRQQYFWEAFPVGIGRNGKQPGTSDVKTTYMFTYLDADSTRPSLESIMEDYWSLLPIYQPSIQNPDEDLDFKRVLFAYFPTYRDSPLKPQWNRILAVGDASGIQSPLSFGGFGALTRHLSRITGAVSEALELDLLHKDDLGAINPYTPNLSATWMFQKAMSVKPGQKTDADFVNRLLAVNFEVMNQMGKRTIKPFLQDVVRFDGLVSSLGRCFIADPTFMPKIVAHVGLPQLVDWVGHVSMMGLYTALHNVGTPIVKPVVRKYVKDERQQYLWRRRMEAWEYGSGSDYELPKEN
ncbi:hypothetical protein FisN_33Hh056 [Fistulifera solaris]|uniref:Uncharacterized protein n=1 Tax=Fistulifera solaris TaxID=1519565 RepID=A0A1Z5KQS6_FISSO|nr:hypothetical protein FisN_33Hh056 [Fistulifera solaris]|eukprot:GAX28670.1 hypothetical protein FisN_33Hh056 [Fistulifera solaris]